MGTRHSFRKEYYFSDSLINYRRETHAVKLYGCGFFCAAAAGLTAGMLLGGVRAPLRLHGSQFLNSKTFLVVKNSTVDFMIKVDLHGICAYMNCFLSVFLFWLASGKWSGWG